MHMYIYTCVYKYNGGALFQNAISAISKEAFVMQMVSLDIVFKKTHS